MATIAHPVSGLEVATPDAMDLHSDSGYDLGDGDIDFEFDSATAVQQDDDDLSLHDAAPDTGLTPLPDQDDFMADKDDLIEEDDIDYNDVEVVDAAQPSLNSPVIAQEATIDDDLIDYSDDEDERPSVIQDVAPRVDKTPEEQDATAESVTSQLNPGHGPAETHDQTVDEVDTYEYQEEEIDYDQELNQTADQACDNAPGPDWEHDANDEYREDLFLDNESQQQQEEKVHSEEKDADQHVQLADPVATEKIAQAEQNTVVDHDNEVDEPLHSHPVTINYDGSEYWLFKPDDSENDDDWLLSDPSIAKSNLLFLIQACRAAIGEEISNETEMGFRFDHFHNLELFEDSMTCLQVTLHSLINSYLKLHAQDGTTSPESFYITLQFRPRVRALLAELDKAIDGEIGYSGFNTAVATGQTAFNTPYSNEATDETYENLDGEEETEHNGDTVEQVEDYEEGVSHDISPQHNEHNEQSYENHSPYSHTDQANAHSVGEEGTTDNDAHQAVNVPDATATPSNNEQTPATRYSVEDDGDIIDYSDDEDATNDAQPDQASVHNPSPGSSTVQGDDAVYADINAEDSTNPTDPNEGDNQPGYSYDEGVADGQDGQDGNVELDGNFANYEEDTGAEASAYDGQAFDEEYDQGYGQDLSEQAFDAGDYSAQEANAGDDSYYYEDAGADQQEDLEFSAKAGDDNNIGVSNEAADQDEFADLADTFDTNAGETASVRGASHNLQEVGTNDVAEDDYITYEDDEDGAVEQPAVATSAAVETVAASSTGLDHEGSPQGHKRSFDEVVNGLDIGTDLSDSKRLRV
ncbi:hypothetical protein K505DRAFT_148408 [Melanomma pulvis-pyrius CBS 109.77]|uniref:Uncharacterized protein n=1 Tax=Melanomma pulvis-pyrius CBS 109.77 TaxID=1314802 RepID=A0A6A6XM03_9PLEO|nr:hypothetical protein K505DRAFT_148408 [Melanomma pulvis-pyrius CBS 109.77]